MRRGDCAAGNFKGALGSFCAGSGIAALGDYIPSDSFEMGHRVGLL